jgi:serine/threonine protein kinase
LVPFNCVCVCVAQREMGDDPATVKDLKAALDANGVDRKGLTLKTDLLRVYRAHVASRIALVHPPMEPNAQSYVPTTIKDYKVALDAAGVDYSKMRLRRDYEAAYQNLINHTTDTTLTSKRSLSSVLSGSGAPTTIAEYKAALDAAGVDRTNVRLRRDFKAAYENWLNTSARHDPTTTRVITLPPPPPPPPPTSARRSDPNPVVVLNESKGAISKREQEAERLRWKDATLGTVVRDTRDPNKAYRLVRYLASGTYGQVWVALPDTVVKTTLSISPSVTRPKEMIQAEYAEIETKNAAHRVAIKLLWIDPDSKDGLDAEALSEVALQKHLKHPNVLSVITTLTYRGPTQEYLGVVMPLEKENLGVVLKRWEDDRKRVGMKEDVRRRMRMIRDIGCGVAYMAANGFAHMDLKPANILVSVDGVGRIADLGMSRLVAGAKLGRSPNEIVTTWWRPPELWCGMEDYSAKVDDWSLGCMVYEIAFRVFPFEIDEQTDSTMSDIGAKLGFPNSFRELLRRGPTDAKVLDQQRPLLRATPERQLTPKTLDVALMPIESDRDYYKAYFGGTLYAEIWNYLFDLLRVDPRLRRNDGLGSPTLFGTYPCRVTPPKHDALVTHISDTDAYPARSFKGIRDLTRQYAQFLWNRMVAEKNVPAGETTLWWLATLALACKLMDEADSIKVPLEGGIEDALMAALDDPWRGFLIDPDSEVRKGRTAPFTVAAPYAPAPPIKTVSRPSKSESSTSVPAHRPSLTILRATPPSPTRPYLISSPLTPVSPLHSLSRRTSFVR